MGCGELWVILQLRVTRHEKMEKIPGHKYHILRSSSEQALWTDSQAVPLVTIATSPTMSQNTLKAFGSKEETEERVRKR